MSKRIILSHIFLLSMLLAGTVRTSAQDRWDSVLDRYEIICAQCIDIRQLIAAGDAVRDRRITTLLGELGALRQTLQEASGSMSAAQRTRFRAIQQRYAEASGGPRAVSASAVSRTVSAPAVRETPARRNPVPDRQFAKEATSELPGAMREDTPLPELEAPAAPVLRSADRQISLQPRQAAPFPAPAAGPAESLRSAPTVSLLALYGHGAASSCGLMAAAEFGAHWGVWGSVRSNFTASQGRYDCASDGSIFPQGRFWGNGQSRYGILSFAGGPLWKPLSWLGFYAGPGFTREELDWQDAEGNWARVRDYSFAGLSADAGLLLQWKRLVFTAGCSWCTYATLTAGIGVSF